MFGNCFQQPACSEAKASDKYTPLARSPDVITAESFVSTIYILALELIHTSDLLLNHVPSDQVTLH